MSVELEAAVTCRSVIMLPSLYFKVIWKDLTEPKHTHVRSLAPHASAVRRLFHHSLRPLLTPTSCLSFL